jgi:hypothetical protein
MTRTTEDTHPIRKTDRHQSIAPSAFDRPHEIHDESRPPPFTALGAVIRQLPWAIGSVAVIVVVAFGTGSLKHPPSDALVNRWGVGASALAQGKLWTIVTSNFLIDHPAAIISTVVLAIVATGVCELLYGTWRAAFAWFMGTWAPLILAIILLLPAHLMYARGTVDRLTLSEVGSSTATWCCAGAIVGFPWLVRGWRRFVGLAAIALLIAILFVHRTFTSVEHFTAIFTGMALQYAWRGRPSRLTTVSRETAARLMCIICGAVYLIELALTGFTRESIALLPIGIALVTLSTFVARRIDVPLAILTLVGGVLANVLVPNAATILAVGAALWLLLYRGPWTLPEMVGGVEDGTSGQSSAEAA